MVQVVPDKSSRESKTKKYVGNNLSLSLEGGKRRKLLVVGNGCCVQVKDNLAALKVVGDGCTVHVLSGGGEVVYIGNNGSVYLDQSIDEDVVTYVGSNGKVSSKNGIRRHSSDSDVRNCGQEVKVVNVDGQCNVSLSGVSGVRTSISAKKFAKIASTISLPNIQIHLGK
ncbi:uncharacterized protein LOC135133560 [Zophobas morio]|mgnify:FL=1|uniref:uncharacterized protein LOC135133560 n=1 Tax=Zophobas morio TaxID=2755281 RepID=UPI003082CAB1